MITGETYGLANSIEVEACVFLFLVFAKGRIMVCLGLGELLATIFECCCVE